MRMHVNGGIAVFSAALIVRAALPLFALARAGNAGIFKAPDTGSYIECAEALARGEGFTRGGKPEIVRTPGYPLLLVPGVLAGRVAAVTIPLQVVLGALTAWLVCRLTGLLTERPRAVFIAGMLCAVEPLSVCYCAILLSETLFATILLSSVFLFARFLRRGRLAILAAAACGFAAAVYVRPVAYWLSLLMAPLVLAADAKGRNARARRVLRACAFLSLAAVLIGAWQARNYLLAGYPGFSAISDINMYFYHGAGVEAARSGEPYYLVQAKMGYGSARIFLDRHPRLVGGIPAERYRAMGREGREIIRAHPRVFLKRYGIGLIQTAFGPGATEYLKLFGLYREGSGLLGEFYDRGFVRTLRALPREKPLVFWSSLCLAAVLGAYFACAVRAFQAEGVRRTAAVALLLPAMYLLLLSGGETGNSRFRQPVMPIVCVFAGCGIDALLRGRRGPFYTGGGSARVVD